MNRRLLSAALIGLLSISHRSAAGDVPAMPGEGFPASRYETLWTKSPFAVETPEAAQGSPDYQLVGIARFDGVSYASLIETQTQQHFLLSSDQPVRGLTLISITRGQGPAGNQVIVQKNGQQITLHQDTSNTGPGPGQSAPPGVAPAPAPAPVAQPLPMPGAGGPGTAPFPRRRFLPIHLPPSPGQVAPAPAPPVPPPH